MSLIRTSPQPDELWRAQYELGRGLIKQAAAPAPSYALSGLLYLSRSGWLLLSVPNALVRGVFSALDEPGLELPLNDEGQLNAHISVFRPEELDQIGGPDKVTERGKRFSYRLGGLETVEPEGWAEMARVWMLRVHSPALQELRRSYGLSSLPNEGRFAFHITVGVKRKAVLGRNEVSKATLAATA